MIFKIVLSVVWMFVLFGSMSACSGGGSGGSSTGVNSSSSGGSAAAPDYTVQLQSMNVTRVEDGQVIPVSGAPATGSTAVLDTSR